MALPSLIPAIPSLIQQKKGYFSHSADGERNVLIRPFQRHILCRVTCSMPETHVTPVLIMPFLKPGKDHKRPRKSSRQGEKSTAQTTAGLSHGTQRHGAGICSGPTSGSMMHDAGSTPSRSGGGARTATRSWMICGEFCGGEVSYHCPGSFLFALTSPGS